MPSWNADRYLKFAAERCYRTDQSLPGYPGRRSNWGRLAVGSSPTTWGATPVRRFPAFLSCLFNLPVRTHGRTQCGFELFAGRGALSVNAVRRGRTLAQYVAVS